MEKIQRPKKELALLSDFYQLTMAYAYWKAGIHQRKAAFHLFFRRPPFHGGFTIASGLDPVIEFIESFHYSASDLEYLSSIKTQNDTPYFDDGFLSMLEHLRLSVDVHAVEEGTCVFPYEPLLRVEGPLMQGQLLESPLLNLVNFSTLITTKASRICLAAQGDPVVEFGLRRAQGKNGALTASRACFVGGCTSTSNVLAGKTFGIPVQGTIAHSWIMAFDDEEEAFMTYAQVLPDACVFLVDTYDTIEGVKKAVRVGQWLKSHGKKLIGVRLDSGDLAQLSIQTRKILDEAGFQDAEIIASNELDEIVISELKHQGAKITMWGVGTNLVTGKEFPALDGVYKLSAIQDPKGHWKNTLKLSEQFVKISNPGRLQIKRFMNKDLYFADMLYDIELGIHDYSECIDLLDATKVYNLKSCTSSFDVLVPVFKEGKCVYKSPTLREIQKKTQSELSKLPVGIKRFLNPHTYPVGMEKELYKKKVELIKKIRTKMK